MLRGAELASDAEGDVEDEAAGTVIFLPLFLGQQDTEESKVHWSKMTLLNGKQIVCWNESGGSC
jgi:hypothetical protein